MGAVYPAICGEVLVGQTLCATWRTTWDEPQLVLNSATFSITITEGPLISLSVNRPVLFLNGGALDKQSSSTKTFERAVLQLNGKPFVIQPFLGVVLNKARLYLRGQTYLLGLSSSLLFERPLLILRGGRLARVGRAGLIPTTPESRPLVPTVDPGQRPLVPTSASSRTLVATATGTRPLQPTVDEDDVLLVPTETVVR